MASEADKLIAEANRRRLVREASRRAALQGPALPTGAPVESAPAAPVQPPQVLDVGQGRTMADVQGMSDQFGRRGPVTVGKAAMPESINKVMTERGIPSTRRALGHALDMDLGGGYDPATYGNRADALLGKGVMDIGSGLKQLTVGLSPQDEANVEARRALSQGASMGEGEGFINAGTVGDIAGNVGAFAAPLGAAEMAVTKAASALPRWMSKVGAAGVVGGAEGGAQPVLEDDYMSRGANIALGAALPMAISSGVQAGRKALTGMFERNEAAEILADEGVQTTLGQGVETSGFRPFAKLVKNIEENLQDILPGLKGGRERAENEVAAALAKRAIPPGFDPPVSQPGTDTYFKEMDTIFDGAYDDALKGIKGKYTYDDIELGVLDALANKGPMVDKSVRGNYEKRIYELLDDYQVSGMTARQLKDFQNKVRSEIRELSQRESLSDNAQGMKDIYGQIDTHINGLFESRLDAAGASALRETNKAYGAKMLLEDSRGFQRARDEPEIPVRNLERAVRKRTSQRNRIRGYGGGQDIIDPAFQTMGPGQDPRWFRALGGVGLGAGGLAYAPLMAGPALVTSMAGSRRAGARALFGLNPMQERAKQMMDAVVEPKIGTATALLNDKED